MFHVNVEARLSKTAIPALHSSRMLYLLIQAVEGAPHEDRRLSAVNLGVLVDVSRSMRIPMLNDEQFRELARRGAVREVVTDGIPVWQFENAPRNYADKLPTALGFVQAASSQIVNMLSGCDTIAVIAFASKAKVLVPCHTANDTQKLAEAIARLKDTDLGDDTYLAEGLSKSVAETSCGVAADRVSRLLVLTDGFTEDEEACRAVVEQARRRGIVVSTMGLGSEFNQELMIELAEQSGGSARFCPSPDEIELALISELGAAMSVMYRDLHVRLRFSQGIELRGVYRVRPDLADLGLGGYVERSLTVSLGDLEPSGGQAILVEVVVPPRPPGTYRLAQLALSYTMQWGETRVEDVKQDIVVEYTANGVESETDPAVSNIVERLSAFKLQMRAAQDLRAGDVSGATQKLRTAATRLLDMGEVGLSEAVQAEADNLQQHGQMSAGGTKKLRYETRRLTRKMNL